MFCRPIQTSTTYQLSVDRCLAVAPTDTRLSHRRSVGRLSSRSMHRGTVDRLIDPHIDRHRPTHRPTVAMRYMIHRDCSTGLHCLYFWSQSPVQLVNQSPDLAAPLGVIFRLPVGFKKVQSPGAIRLCKRLIDSEAGFGEARSCLPERAAGL